MYTIFLPYLLIALLYQPIASRNRPPILVILHCVSVQFQTLSIGFYFFGRKWSRDQKLTIENKTVSFSLELLFHFMFLIQ